MGAWTKCALSAGKTRISVFFLQEKKTSMPIKFRVLVGGGIFGHPQTGVYPDVCLGIAHVSGKGLYQIHGQSLNTHRGKHRSGGARYFWVLGGGGKCRFYFYGREDFSERRCLATSQTDPVRANTHTLGEPFFTTLTSAGRAEVLP